LAALLHGWSKKRRDDGTDDGTPVGPYATGHCPVVVCVRRTHDGTLARGVVQATGQTMRHVELREALKTSGDAGNAGDAGETR